MNKLLLDLNHKLNGMVLGEDVYNRFGAVIANKGTILDKYIIDKLFLNEVSKVTVNYEDSAHAKEVFNQTYMAVKDEVKRIIKDISSGKDINVESIEEVSDSLVDIVSNISIYNVMSYINQLKNYDEYTYNHSVNVAILSILMARWLGYGESEIDEVAMAGILHDIGKCEIDKKILNKPARLTKEEFEKMKQHPYLGYSAIKNNNKLNTKIKNGVLMHHERANGTGYPYGYTSRDISQYAKIIAISDVYDAMTSKRVYHEAENPFKVLDMLKNHSTNLFDNYILETFLNNMASLYIGDTVLLSTGERGRIVFINKEDGSSPIIRLDNKVINLMEEKDISIEKVVM